MHTKFFVSRSHLTGSRLGHVLGTRKKIPRLAQPLDRCLLGHVLSRTQRFTVAKNRSIAALARHYDAAKR